MLWAILYNRAICKKCTELESWRMKFHCAGQWIPSGCPVPSAVILHPVTRAALSIEPFMSLQQHLSCRRIVSEKKTYEKRGLTQPEVLTTVHKVAFFPFPWAFPFAFGEAGAHAVSEPPLQEGGRSSYDPCLRGRRSVFFSCLLANGPSSLSRKSFPRRIQTRLLWSCGNSYLLMNRVGTPQTFLCSVWIMICQRTGVYRKTKGTGLIIVRSKKLLKAGQVRSLMLREIKPHRT